MTDRTIPEPVDLDRQWDAVIRGDDGEAIDPLLDRLHRMSVRQPSSHFVTDLRSALVVAATADQSDPVGLAPSGPASTPGRQNTRPSARAARSRRFDRIGTIASVAAAALLLVMIAGTLYRTLPVRQSGPGGFIQAPPPTAKPLDFADMPMPGADPARSNTQPGPGITGNPAILARTDISGTNMILANNLLIVLTNGLESSVVALNPETLDQIWKRKLADGFYSSPVASGDQLLLTYTRNTEVGTQNAENNALLALSLADGSDRWKSGGAASTSGDVVPVGDSVFAVAYLDNKTVFGSYRADNGSPNFQVSFDYASACCGGSLVIDGNIAIIRTAYHLIAVDTNDGSRLWVTTAQSSEIYDSLVSNGHYIWASSSSTPGAPIGSLPQAGSVYVYELDNGVLLQRVGGTNSRVAAGHLENGESAQTVVIGVDLNDGSRWLSLYEANSMPALFDPARLPDPTGDAERFDNLQVQPVVIDQSVYAVFGTPDDGTGRIGTTLLTAIAAGPSEATARTEWMALFDGRVQVSPIISGGRAFVLTSDVGLYVFGSAPVADSTPAASPAASASTFDFRTTITCNAVVVTNPLLGVLPNSPAIPGATPRSSIVSENLPKGGRSVDQATADSLTALFADYRNCSAVDPYNDVYSFFSTDFYVRLKDLGVENIEGGIDQPWAIWMAPTMLRLTLDTGSLRQLDDGRIGGLVSGEGFGIYVWFVNENGAWKIDEYRRIIDTSRGTPFSATPIP